MSCARNALPRMLLMAAYLTALFTIDRLDPAFLSNPSATFFAITLPLAAIGLWRPRRVQREC